VPTLHFSTMLSHHSYRILLVAGAFFAAGVSTWAQSSVTPAPSLKNTLRPEDFKRAGLQKLTPEELAHLDSLVQLRQASSPAGPASAAVPGALQGEAAFGKDKEIHQAATVMLKVPDEIRSRIRGRFTGWTGRTTFHLENGQVWRQSEGGEFSILAESPEVVIRRGAFGTYFLRVDGYGTRTKVVRVK
jgi:hypothetical protein